MAATVETIELSSDIRVALIIEAGRIKPVWFEERDRPGRDRVFIREVCQTWSHQEGAAKVINFAVRDGSNHYKLSLNTREFTWRCGITEA